MTKKKGKNSDPRNRNNKTQTSAIKGLVPYFVIDHDTGEILDEDEWTCQVINLVKYVTEKTRDIVSEREDDFIVALDSDDCPSQVTGIAHKFGLSPDVSDLPERCLSKSRIKELIEHKSVSEYKAYHKNPDPLKQKPTFSNKINLGAVNHQMVTADYMNEQNIVVLSWQCWTRFLDFFFLLPKYVGNYDVDKITKPTIQLEEDADNRILPVFIFAIKENLSYKLNRKDPHHKTIILGYDLGRIHPYKLTVMTDTKRVIAKRDASPKLTQLNDKRERLIANKKQCYERRENLMHQHGNKAKIEKLSEEMENLASAISALGRDVALQMGAELNQMSTLYNVDVCVGENLTWVSRAYGMSRWVHGACEDAISHSVRRNGVKHHTVYAANSSHECPKCHSLNTWLDSERQLHCQDCDWVEDKDDTASEIIACRRAGMEFRARMKRLNALRLDGSEHFGDFKVIA